MNRPGRHDTKKQHRRDDRHHGPGHAWLIRPMAKPATLVAGQPLNYAPFPIVGVGPDSLLDYTPFEVTRTDFRLTARVEKGVLIRSDR